MTTEIFRKSPLDRFSQKGRLHSLKKKQKPSFQSFFFFIEIQLIYNVLISAVQQNDSVRHINTLLLCSFPLLFITGC